MTLPQISGPLFEQVQLCKLFADCKTWVDAQCLADPAEIEQAYLRLSQAPDFDLLSFIKQYFIIPEETTQTLAPLSSHTSDMFLHIENLWNILTRPADDLTVRGSSLIALPYPYVVPGGRFREIYYWDCYFTSIGLAVHHRFDLIENMLKNFKHLIDTIGFVPNGNRYYYASRSQPPVLACLLDLLREPYGMDVVLEYIPTLEKEYAFWMHGQEMLSENHLAEARVVRLPNGAILNRYWDSANSPRPESYREDLHLSMAHHTTDFYQHIRAACESGWDFSSRWFADGQHLSTIHTLNVIPVDLNMWLYKLEKTLATYHTAAQNHTAQAHFSKLAQNRADAVQHYLWSEADGFYFDYYHSEQCRSPIYSIAGCTPLFAKLATPAQAKRVAEVLTTRFLKPGGLVTTLVDTGQQWDAPNGWAPCQWLAVQGLLHYNEQTLAHEIMQRWLLTNERVFQATGKMMEKYNVCDTTLLAQGGEYPAQDGFGWTNGIALKFRELLATNSF